MRIEGLHHFGLTVSNIERSAAWYRENFGFKTPKDFIRGNKPWFAKGVGYEGAQARMGFISRASTRGTILVELHEYVVPVRRQMPPDTTYVGASHMAIAVDDVVAEYDRLVANGVQFISAPVKIPDGLAEGGHWCYAFDPDGYIVELCQAREINYDEWLDQ